MARRYTRSPDPSSRQAIQRIVAAAVAGALAALCACGSSGGGGGGGTPASLVDLTGRWMLTPSVGGVDGDAAHLTVTETGTAVRVLLTCSSSWPAGTGTWDGHALAVTFDFGGGSTFSLAGAALGDAIAGSYTSSDGPGTFTMERTDIALACEHACDPVVVAPFVDTDFTELDKIEEISRFRSSAGHDYSDDCEACRSMKHYFAPYAAYRANNAVIVRSPVDGQIVSVTAEGHGASDGTNNKQVRVRSTAHPEVTFILFHVDVTSGAVAGDAVTAGQLLGTARMVYPDLMETAHDFDIAVRVHTLYGDRYVSWFDVVSDALFASYVARGATSRSDFVLTKAARDADPLTCSGEAFTSSGTLDAWFVLAP